jgi:hypothetical protein
VKLIIFCLGTCLIGHVARASDLFYTPCVISEEDEEAALTLEPRLYQADFMGLSCQNIKDLKEGYDIFNATIAPAMSLLLLPGAAEGVSAALAEAGLTLSNPPMLLVSIMGATAGASVYVVLKMSLKECERQDREKLKKEIFQELKKKLPGLMGSSTDFPLEIETI